MDMTPVSEGAKSCRARAIRHIRRLVQLNHFYLCRCHQAGTLKKQAEEDDEFDYAFEGGKREGEFHKQVGEGAGQGRLGFLGA